MVRYIKCPRCELNYIDAEKQEYCDVCLKELAGIDTDMEDENEEVLTELCPVCGENMMRAGDKMCEECRKRVEYDEKDPDPDKDDEEWRNYLDDDNFEEDEDIGEINETFDDEFEEEDEEEYSQADDDEDMEYVTGDEIYKLGDDEDDEDEDEDDDF